MSHTQARSPGPEGTSPDLAEHNESLEERTSYYDTHPVADKLATAATYTMTTGAVLAFFALCPPMALYCGAKAAYEGYKSAEHWVQEHTHQPHH
jgi:hypothetical protein